MVNPPPQNSFPYQGTRPSQHPFVATPFFASTVPPSSSIAGAMLIARALDNPELSEQFLQSVINAWPAAPEKEEQASVSTAT